MNDAAQEVIAGMTDFACLLNIFVALPFMRHFSCIAPVSYSAGYYYTLADRERYRNASLLH